MSGAKTSPRLTGADDREAHAMAVGNCEPRT
jgi:hypothetical protein